ncbi:thymidylate kinase [cyanobacterium endosymbiont of Braarudosphaera bigelowii]|uniref:Thymidylate kinase n=3 Tax=Candidatus Atelocyanobacterium thalassae TaxID=713887 RepID=A0A086CGL1_9CHRO|nr:MAG: thymidylate kinase [Candidatus Atelocyanobacterium thalassa isolate SIO64986]BDA39357.1 thymidylate kinase [cyanobacterium endosymbiont of Braarudosphaera bigelowii]
MMKPLFIVLEGIDKSGKTTQAELLKNYLIEHGNLAVISSEPTNSSIGKLIREGMQNQLFSIEDRIKFDEQMAYLFAADRHYHLYNDIDGVFKLIQQNNYTVISTRYYFSSLAYNSNNPEEIDFVYQLNQKFPNPDLVIYIDVPLDVALSRLKNSTFQEIYETKDKLDKVRKNYQTIFNNYKGNLLKINGKNSIDNVHKDIIHNLIKQV